MLRAEDHICDLVSDLIFVPKCPHEMRRVHILKERDGVSVTSLAGIFEDGCKGLLKLDVLAAQDRPYDSKYGAAIFT